jgi:hypothetical protein
MISRHCDNCKNTEGDYHHEEDALEFFIELKTPNEDVKHYCSRRCLAQTFVDELVAKRSAPLAADIYHCPKCAFITSLVGYRRGDVLVCGFCHAEFAIL